MLDDVTTGTSTPLPRCMWCSAELPSDNETVCPTCGATLIGDPIDQVPGVTAIDAEAIVRAARGVKPKQRSRLMSWISGESEEDADKPAPPGSLSPPPPAVRREMLRLEMEAEVANLQAEAGAMAAEAAVESGTTLDIRTDAVTDTTDADVTEADTSAIADAGTDADAGSDAPADEAADDTAADTSEASAAAADETEPEPKAERSA
jgi:hypothetical protein